MVEFDRHLSQIQGCLLSGQNVLQNLTDSERCEEICNRLSKVLKKCPADYETRSIFLYLLLNCSSVSVKDIAEDENFGHLVNTAPSQSLNLVLKVILKLDGLKFLREIVTFAPKSLSESVMEALLNDKGFDLASYQGKTVVSVELSKACYHRLVLSKGEDFVCLKKYVSYFKALQSFDFLYLCENMQLGVYSTYDLGVAFLQNLEACLFCLEDDTLQDESKIWDDFLIHFKSNFRMLMLNDKSEPRSHCELLYKCRDLIISKLKMLAQAVTVDVWLDWAEVDMKPSQSLQQVIGETAYECKRKLEFLRKQPFSDIDEFLEILSNFVLDPKHEEDELKDVSIEIIKANLSNTDSSSKKWLKALLQQSIVLENDDTIQLIKINSKLLDEDDVTLLLEKLSKKIKDENKNDSETLEILRDLSYQIMKYLPLESLFKIHDKYGKEYGFSQVFCGRDYHSHLLEAFNRTTSGTEECADEWRCELVRLSLQNSHCVVEHAIGAALLDSDSAKIMLEVLIFLRSVSADIILEWISKVSSSSPFQGVQLDNFPKLVLNFAKENLLSIEILTMHIMRGIYQAIQDHNWAIISMWLSTLQYLLESSGGNLDKTCKLAVLLAYLGQVMEYSQQPPKDFSLSCVVARQKAVGVLQSLNNIQFEDSDKEWLHNNIRKFSIINQCHFGVFISKIDPTFKKEDLEDFPFELCFDKRVKTPEHVTRILVQMVPFLTISEWEGLTIVLKQMFAHHNDCGYSLFLVFRQALLLLACCSVGFDEDSNFISCLNYCIRCFGTVIKAYVLPVLKRSNFPLVLEETLHLLSKLPTKVWDRGGMYILPVVVNLMQDVQIEVERLNVLFAVISTCPSNQGRTIIEKKLKEKLKVAINEDVKLITDNERCDN